MKKILYFLLAAAAVCVIAACSTSSSPGKAAKTYAEYIRDGQYEKFTDALYFEEGTSEEDMKESKLMIQSLLTEKAAKSIEENGGITQIEIVSEEIGEDGKTANVKLRQTFGNGETEDSDYDLILDKGVWKIETNK